MLRQAPPDQQPSPGRSEEERDYYSLQERVYRLFAPIYDAVTRPFRELRREAASAAGVGPGAKVLDVATGTGAQAFALGAKGARVIGIDLSAAMLRVARRKNRFPNVTFQQGDASELPFADAAFDVSCVSFALHEMPASIRARVLREMARVTRPGGSVLIVDYGLPRGRLASSLVYHFVKLYEPEHYATFMSADIPALLGSAGIELSTRRPALFGLATIIIGRRSEAVAPVRPGARRPSGVASVERRS